jgi:hypothetical protein
MLLRDIIHSGILRRNSLLISRLHRSDSLRIHTISPCTRLDILSFLDVLAILVDFAAVLVDQARLRLVAGGEGDVAFESGDFVFVEEVAVFVAVFDLFLFEFIVEDLGGVFNVCRWSDFESGVFGNGWSGATDGGLWSLLGAAGWGWDGEGVLSVLWVYVSDANVCVEGMSTYSIVEVVAVPIPGLEELDAVALLLGPGVAVRERSIEHVHSDGYSEEGGSNGHADNGLVAKGE